MLAADASRPAILGGKPVRTTTFPDWPVITQTDETSWLSVLRSKKWFRGSGSAVDQFEKRFASYMGSPHCLAVANGTSALMTALHGLDVQPGDEVIVPPYTFIATVNAVLSKYALPVFVDTDPETFQMDASKIGAAITAQTRAIIPVHIAGAPPDLDITLAAARARNIKVLEDAAQAHLGEWRGRKLGSIADAGTFSFQASKNLNSGEGGAILSPDASFMERCFAFHNNCNPRRGAPPDLSVSQAANLRLTEFQAALLTTQMERLESQARRRDACAALLTKLLDAIPGIVPARLTSGCTRSAWHLYMFRYDASQFAGLSRDRFLNALKAEGVPASSGYGRLNHAPFLTNVFASRGFQRIYSPARLKQWRESNHTPANDKLTAEAVWFTQTMLLAGDDDMRQIANAIEKIRAHAPALAKQA
jgi:perosamine synthetase